MDHADTRSRRSFFRSSSLLLLLVLAACPESTSDVVETHREKAEWTLSQLTRAIEDVRQRKVLDEDTLEYSGEPLHFEDHDNDASRGIVVTIDAFQRVVESGDYDSSRVYGDRFWSWPLGALAGSSEILDRSATGVEETFRALKRMKFALVIKTREKVAPKFRESTGAWIQFDRGRFVGEGWLVDLGPGASVLGGFRFEAASDPQLLTESEPEKIQAALELDLEFEIRRAARKALVARVPSTVIE